MAKPVRLRLETFVPAGAFYHVARTHVPRSPAPLHTHDFAEVFWIESGEGIHLLNGQREPLQPGTLVFVRPTDVHGFQARATAEMTLVNVAFAAGVFDFLQEHYGTVPRQAPLAPAQLQRVQEWAEQLAQGTPTRLRRDLFMLRLLALVEPVVPANPLPDWLHRAVRQFAQPQHLPGGAQELARLAGRSPEHVNRTVRKALNQTTTDLVNDIRLEYAAHQLRMTDHKIMQIALDCGLSNLGYFYRIFAHQHGLTPRQYRLRERAVVR